MVMTHCVMPGRGPGTQPTSSNGSDMNDDIWVLGATGRSGRGVARRLHASGHHVVLAGRNRDALGTLAAELDGTRVAVGGWEELLGRLQRDAPRVVVSTVGPFARTARQVVDALPAGTHYVDIGNELSGVQAVLDASGRAAAAGSTLVAGGGFGVLATESAVIRLCAGRPTPARVRVDAVPSLAVENGVVGGALAGSMLDGAPDGGLRVHQGRLRRFPVAGARLRLTTPAGDVVTTASLPTGDLLAAWRASRAASVVSATSAIPSGPAVRALFPVVGLLLRPAVIRRFAIDRVARIELRQRPRPQEFSWGHARAEWADGTTAEAWLRLGDAQEFTEMSVAEIARRLTGGQGMPGAHTPAALFGADLAIDLGAVHLT